MSTVLSVRNRERLTASWGAGSGRAIALLAVAVALGASGCSGGGNSAATPPAPSTSATAPPSRTGGRGEHVEGEKVSVAPKPVKDGKVLLSVASRHGNAELPLEAGTGSGPMAVQVNCQGKGTLKVVIEPLAVSFPLECAEGEVSSTYNELALKRAHAEGSVRVSAPSGIRWALTVEQ
ncbi:hypothetical protein AB0I52_02930 [Streptomyces sp. NPDC050423]|uniref:hypothetical protein n=1 Tax=Streptomyces sp. NPDC050423 TaxID=3155402 RepID=UPI003445CD3C